MHRSRKCPVAVEVARKTRRIPRINATFSLKILDCIEFKGGFWSHDAFCEVVLQIR